MARRISSNPIKNFNKLLIIGVVGYFGYKAYQDAKAAAPANPKNGNGKIQIPDCRLGPC